MKKYVPKPKSNAAGHAIDLATTLQYGLGSGNANFLDFLIEHTRKVHNPPYEDWTCLMTAGNTWALELCLRLLLSPGDSLLMEEYTFSSAIECVVPHHIHPVGMPMDDDGVIATALDDMLTNWDSQSRQSRKPRVMYIIPTGQNPTGSSMPADRRREVYAVAQRHDLVILEDEPYYFLQMPEYEAPINGHTNGTHKKANTTQELLDSLVPSFVKIDVDGRVLRFDSFSKTIAPGTRCGWITGASELIERCTRHNEVTIQAPAGFTQIILYNMLALNWGHEGFFQWLLYIREVYTDRRDSCLTAMDAELPKSVVRWKPPLAGMFFWVEIDVAKHPKYTGDIGAIETRLYDKALEYKVLVIPGSWFSAERGRKVTRLFFRGTFACVEQEACRQGVKRFGQMLKDEFGVTS
jgi:aromatic amino acid aminotransferase I